MIDCIICITPLWKFNGVIENNTVKVCKSDGSLSLLSNENDFDQIQMECFEDAAYLWVNDKWGFVDITTGDVFVPPIWDYVEEYQDGLAVVATGSSPLSCDGLLCCEKTSRGKWGCIDRDSKIVIPTEYDALRIRKFHSETVVLAEKDGLKGILNRMGNVIFPFEFSEIYLVGEDSMVCRDQDGTYSFWHNEHPVFKGARTVFKPVDGRNKNYYIGCKERKYAVFCTDGRMISEFSMLLREAKALTEVLCGTTQYRLL